MNSVLVILPTYNEAENIQILIPYIHKALAPLIPHTILVIDDNSPDNTTTVAEKLADNYNVRVKKRPSKLGLGSAYTEGFNYGIARGYSHALTMDADRSHNTKHLGDLLEYGKEYDLVIGSRYIPGGKILNWPFYRNILSKSANFLVKNLLTRTIADNTSGYRLYNLSALKNIDYRLPNNGYAYLFELAYLFIVGGLRVKEVPITFEERRKGSSKVSRAEIYKAFQTLVRLTFNRHRIKKQKNEKI